MNDDTLFEEFEKVIEQEEREKRQDKILDKLEKMLKGE
jgi:hypothetical protein